MSTIRRLYLYAVTFVSLLVITWGLIGLARSAFAGDEIGGDVTRLAGALALIFVGIPVFLLHWWLAQKGAQEDEEERYSYIRAVFLYGALLATLIPVIQNLMALANQLIFSIFDLSPDNAMVGFEQTWSDNLIALIMNGLIAAYIFNVLQKDWAAKPIRNTFAEIRRIYRNIWMLYGLAMTIFGVLLVLLYIFDMLENKAIVSQSNLANGLTLLLVGTPVWVFSWRIIQRALSQIEELEFVLWAIVLYFVSFICLVTTLVAGGAILDTLFQLLLGERFSISELLGALRDPVSVAIPFGITWAYFSYTRRRQTAETQSAKKLQHIYRYLVAFLGLSTAFVGLQKLLYFFIDRLVNQPIWVDILRGRLSIAITMLVVGLPVWIFNWREINQHAGIEGEQGDESRRSFVRKGYLYLVLFIGVMGIMISAGILIFELLQAILGDPEDNLLQISLELSSVLFLFLLLIWYHGWVLRADGKLFSNFQKKRFADFAVLVLVSELGVFSEAMIAALKKKRQRCPSPFKL